MTFQAPTKQEVNFNRDFKGKVGSLPTDPVSQVVMTTVLFSKTQNEETQKIFGCSGSEDALLVFYSIAKDRQDLVISLTDPTVLFPSVYDGYKVYYANDADRWLHVTCGC